MNRNRMSGQLRLLSGQLRGVEISDVLVAVLFLRYFSEDLDNL